MSSSKFARTGRVPCSGYPGGTSKLADMVEEFLEALQIGTVAHGGYQDGRVVDLRAAEGVELYLVGDIHAKFRRISAILEFSQLEPKLAEGSAVLVFLGDLFHREDDQRAGEMESSFETLEALMRLKVKFPRNVYALLGNHEFTRTGSTKRGYFQGELFRNKLENSGLLSGYEQFLRRSPMVVIHPRVVGVHAGPAKRVASLEELKSFVVEDREPDEIPRVILELAFSRHRDWSPNPAKAYSDHEVRDFLALCEVPEARLVTGHTPLDRATDWTWDIGALTSVIFAAGRELGYFRVGPASESFVRVGRSQPDDDDKILFDRSPEALEWSWCRGRGSLLLESFDETIPLQPDVPYRFKYPDCRVELIQNQEPLVGLCHYRHLSAVSKSYHGQGYYVVGREMRMEVLRIKLDLAILIGGAELVDGVRFGWGTEELAILRMPEEGVFELRALVDGIALQHG